MIQHYFSHFIPFKYFLDKLQWIDDEEEDGDDDYDCDYDYNDDDIVNDDDEIRMLLIMIMYLMMMMMVMMVLMMKMIRTNKSPLLVSYLFSIGDPRHPSPLCPLCLMHDHTSSHLFECKSLPTALSSLDLWTNPDKVEPFLATWGERLLAAT